MSEQDAVIGIDLGTTNSCGAVVEGAHARIIPSKRGYNTIPSVVGVDANGEILIGYPAKRQMLINPRNTVYGSKRLVGLRFSSPKVQEIRRYFTYELIPTQGDGIGVKLGDKVLTLPEVSSLILKEVREVAEDYLVSKVSRAIISVPAFYSERQRNAVKEAGRLAGLHVERIISEPTAAALAYGLQKNMNKRILVYDLGGGTFDASIVEIKDSEFNVVASGGDTFLGGVDFDNRLLSQVLYEFLEETGVDLARYPVVVQRLREACEAAKVELSTVANTMINVPFVAKVGGKPWNIERKVTVDELRSLTQDLVDRTMDVCKDVLNDCRLTPSDLDAIILVGGQSRFPLIHEKIFENFKREPSKSVHPDEAVALGTALLAGSLNGGGRKFVFKDVLPMSISLGAPGGRCIRVIDRNTMLPFKKHIKISATPGPDGVFELPVFQGEGMNIDDNEFLGTVKISGEKAVSGQKSSYAVQFSLSQECILTVQAMDMETRKKVVSELSITGTGDSVRKQLHQSSSVNAPLEPDSSGEEAAPASSEGQYPQPKDRSPVKESQAGSLPPPIKQSPPLKGQGLFAHFFGWLRKIFS
ncbi:MAG: Hsp70 family protein [Deltaproteobacteria bacterium]|nr:Hsp70 family protein [Deltaproteobacteria bacterium]